MSLQPQLLSQDTHTQRRVPGGRATLCHTRALNAAFLLGSDDIIHITVQ